MDSVIELYVYQSRCDVERVLRGIATSDHLRAVMRVGRKREASIQWLTMLVLRLIDSINDSSKLQEPGNLAFSSMLKWTRWLLKQSSVVEGLLTSEAARLQVGESEDGLVGDGQFVRNSWDSAWWRAANRCIRSLDQGEGNDDVFIELITRRYLEAIAEETLRPDPHGMGDDASGIEAMSVGEDISGNPMADQKLRGYVRDTAVHRVVLGDWSGYSSDGGGPIQLTETSVLRPLANMDREAVISLVREDVARLKDEIHLLKDRSARCGAAMLNSYAESGRVGDYYVESSSCAGEKLSHVGLLAGLIGLQRSITSFAVTDLRNRIWDQEVGGLGGFDAKAGGEWSQLLFKCKLCVGDALSITRAPYCCLFKISHWAYTAIASEVLRSFVPQPADKAAAVNGLTRFIKLLQECGNKLVSMEACGAGRLRSYNDGHVVNALQCIYTGHQIFKELAIALCSGERSIDPQWLSHPEEKKKATTYEGNKKEEALGYFCSTAALTTALCAEFPLPSNEKSTAFSLVPLISGEDIFSRAFLRIVFWRLFGLIKEGTAAFRAGALAGTDMRPRLEPQHRGEIPESVAFDTLLGLVETLTSTRRKHGQNPFTKNISSVTLAPAKYENRSQLLSNNPDIFATYLRNEASNERLSTTFCIQELAAVLAEADIGVET